MPDIIGIISDVKDKITDTFDNVSTVAFRAFRTTKEKVNDATSGKKKNADESIEESEHLNEMSKKMMMMGGLSEAELQEAYQIDKDGLSFSSVRNAFDVIDKDEYESPDEISIKPVSEQLEDWLFNSDSSDEVSEKKAKKNKKQKSLKPKLKSSTKGKNKKAKKGKKGKKGQEVEEIEEVVEAVEEQNEEIDSGKVKYDPKRISLGRQFKEDFDSDKFDFKSKNAAFMKYKVEFDKKAVERFSNLNYFIEAFAGNPNALTKINNIPDVTFSQRIFNTIKNNLEGELTTDKTGWDLFLEVHGVNASKLPENTNNEKKIAYCVLQDLGLDPLTFPDLSMAQLTNVIDAIKDNVDLSNKDFLYKDLLNKFFDKARTEGDQLKNIRQSNNENHIMIFESDVDGGVSVFHQSPANVNLIGRQDKNGEYVAGNERNLLNLLSKDVNITKEFEHKGDDTLSKLIELQTAITQNFNRDNPASIEEIEQYNREEAEELKKHHADSNPFLNRKFGN